jgi:hypothetical protein
MEPRIKQARAPIVNEQSHNQALTSDSTGFTRSIARLELLRISDCCCGLRERNVRRSNEGATRNTTGKKTKAKTK